jgi:hypothetical protein
MRKRTKEMIELLRRARAHYHAEGGSEDTRGNQARREVAEHYRRVRAIHAKVGTYRLIYLFRDAVSYFDGLD